MNPTTTFDYTAWNPFVTVSDIMADGMTTTREQVAAALIAVVAEAGRDFRATTTRLMDVSGNHCIMGAVMSKLGYPFQQGKAYGGGLLTVIDALGIDQDDTRLARAMSLAISVNDSRYSWGLAQDCFEAELACPGTGMALLRQKHDEMQVQVPTAVTTAMAGTGASFTWVDEAAGAMTEQAMGQIEKSIAEVAVKTAASFSSFASTMFPKTDHGYHKVSLTWNTDELLAKPQMYVYDTHVKVLQNA